MSRAKRSDAKAWLKAQKDYRASLLRQYARLDRAGNPIFCHAPYEEIIKRQRKGWKELKNKIIFDSVDLCEHYLKDIGELEAMRIYECPFSSHGHVHFTRQR